MRFTVTDVVLFKSLNHSLDLSFGHIDLVSSDSLGIIAIFSDDGSSRLLIDNESLVNKLNFLSFLFLKDDISVVFSFLLGDNEDLLDPLTFLDLDVFNISLSEGWLNLVEVIEGFLSLNILSDGLFSNDSHLR